MSEWVKSFRTSPAFQEKSVAQKGKCNARYSISYFHLPYFLRCPVPTFGWCIIQVNCKKVTKAGLVRTAFVTFHVMTCQCCHRSSLIFCFLSFFYGLPATKSSCSTWRRVTYYWISKKKFKYPRVVAPERPEREPLPKNGYCTNFVRPLFKEKT